MSPEPGDSHPSTVNGHCTHGIVPKPQGGTATPSHLGSRCSCLSLGAIQTGVTLGTGTGQGCDNDRATPGDMGDTGTRGDTRTHPVAFDSRQAGGPGEATSALWAVRGQLGTGRGQGGDKQWLCHRATGATLTWGPGGPRSPDFPGLPVSPYQENGIFKGLGTQKCHLFVLAQPGFGVNRG